jgi:hypothetical protein
MNNMNQSRFDDSFLSSIKQGKIAVAKKNFTTDASNMYIETDEKNNLQSQYMEFTNSVLNYPPMTNPINQKGQSFHSNYKNDCINTCENTTGCTGINFWDPDTIFYPEVSIESATLGQNCLLPKASYTVNDNVKKVFSEQCSTDDNRELCELKPDWYNAENKITNCNNKEVKVNYNCLRTDSSGRDIVSEDNNIIVNKQQQEIKYNKVVDKNGKKTLTPVNGIDCRKLLADRIEIKGVSYAHNLSNYIKTDKIQDLCSDTAYGNNTGCGPLTFEQIIHPNDDPNPDCNNKNLEVEYMCGDVYKKETFTKDGGFKIECPTSNNGKNNLKIISAVYGRTCENDTNNLKVIDTITQISKDSEKDVKKFITEECLNDIGKNSRNECVYKISDDRLNYFKQNKAILTTNDNSTPNDRFGNIDILEAKYASNCANVNGYEASNESDIMNLKNICGDNTKTQCNVDSYKPVKDPLVDKCILASQQNGTILATNIGKSTADLTPVLYYIKCNNLFLTGDFSNVKDSPIVVLKEFTNVNQSWEIVFVNGSTTDFNLKLYNSNPTLYLKMKTIENRKTVRYCNDGDSNDGANCRVPITSRNRDTKKISLRPCKEGTYENLTKDCIWRSKQTTACIAGKLVTRKSSTGRSLITELQCNSNRHKRLASCCENCPEGYDDRDGNMGTCVYGGNPLGGIATSSISRGYCEDPNYEDQGLICSKKCDPGFKSSGPFTCIKEDSGKLYKLKERIDITYTPNYSNIFLFTTPDIWRIDDDGNFYNVSFDAYVNVSGKYGLNLVSRNIYKFISKLLKNFNIIQGLGF